jgi:predicted lactoylglutathione lyase
MDQRVSMITLGVADVGRAKTFYERLGWQGQTVQQTVFFQIGGLALVLWGRQELADDAGLEHARTNEFGGVALAHNVGSPSEVDAAIRLAEEAGATVTRRPEKTFYGGYAGYFTDPDGHAWEVAHNPGFVMHEDGTITVPDFDALALPANVDEALKSRT